MSISLASDLDAEFEILRKLSREEVDENHDKYLIIMFDSSSNGDMEIDFNYIDTKIEQELAGYVDHSSVFLQASFEYKEFAFQDQFPHYCTLQEKFFDKLLSLVVGFIGSIISEIKGAFSGLFA